MWKVALLLVPVAATDGDWVRVPGGSWVHKSCVTEVSNGEVADPPECPYPTYRADEWSPNGGTPEVQCYDQKAYVSASTEFTQMNATFVVPPLPRSAGGQTVYLWPGFKATRPIIGRPVLQPVLQYRGNGHWELQSWAVGIPSGVITAPAFRVTAGDTLTTYMQLTGDTWTIYGRSTNTGKETNLKISKRQAGSQPYNNAVFVSENVMPRHQCNLYPANSGLEFKDIVVNGKAGAKWQSSYDCGSPDCGQKVISNSDGTSVSLTWNPSPVAPKPAWGYKKMWEDFKAQYGKTYDANGVEEARFAIFRMNVDYIEATNAQELGYTLGVNQFADLTEAEVVEQYTGARKPAPLFEGPYLGEHMVTNEALPDSVDWTAQGKVTSVKNQGHCGSCWAFSSTGALESANAIATGSIVSLSEQQLVDCHVGNGCSGGWPYSSFRYAESTAMCTESEYPYTARDGSCHANSCTGLKRGAVTGYKTVTKSESDLRSAVARGPVSITVQAGGGMSRYKSGVLRGGCSGQINHAVLAVGYGILGGTKYWKVKNSWGSSWGMNGYFLLQRGSGGQGAYCVLQDSPTYPVVASDPSNFVV